MAKTLIVITGPTGVGKTGKAIELAQSLGTEIVSADSRQLYRDIPIGTAAPTAEELAMVKHHFVGILGLEEYYSAAKFEVDALEVIKRIFAERDYAVMCGGSMLYVDAICRGIDDIPTISDEVRSRVAEMVANCSPEELCETLRSLDPAYHAIVDLNNTKRVAHAIEICLQAGVPYSTLRTGKAKPRDFEIVKIALNLPREELFDRINRRVDAMVEQGLEEEARRVYPLRHLNSLNTVGFKEMFAYFDGTMERGVAIERIKKNTRVYAKKQLTWFQRDTTVRWLHPSAPLSDFMP